MVPPINSAQDALKAAVMTHIKKTASAMTQLNYPRTWIAFAASLLVGPAAFSVRGPQHVFWYLNPQEAIFDHYGNYLLLASVPLLAGVTIGVCGLALRRAWLRFGLACAFNVLLFLLAATGGGY